MTLETSIRNFAIKKLLGQLHVAVRGGSVWVGVLEIEGDIVTFGSANGVDAKLHVELKVSEQGDLFLSWRVVHESPAIKFVSSEGDTLTTHPNAYSTVKESEEIGDPLGLFS